jgi:hypothetical protein
MYRCLSPLSVTALLAAATVGCSDQYGGRQAVSGKVTVKGAALKQATIEFIPQDGQDTRGGSPVVDGAYSIPRDAGLKPGKYLVRLTAGDGKTPQAEEEIAGPGGSSNIVSFDLIPPEFGVASKKEVTVTAEGPNTFDIDLPYLLDPAKEKKRKR